MRPIFEHRPLWQAILAVLAGVVVVTQTSGLVRAEPGEVVTDFGAFEEGQAVALQPNGKIVVGGVSGNELALVRYNPDGSLDTSFGVGGEVIGGRAGSFASKSLAFQSDGKILIGRPTTATGGTFLLTRYNADGELDTGFGTGGNAFVGIIARGDHSLALQPDGKILIAGAVSPGITFANFIAVARLGPDGSLDASFGTNGEATTSIEGLARSVVLQLDDKIIVAGESFSGITDYFTVVRFNPDGSPDMGFGTDGVVRTNIEPDDEAYDMVLQPNGKLVVVGNARNRFVGTSFAALVRYTPDGSLDAIFGTGGIVATEFVGAHSVELQPDGKFLVAGWVGADSDPALLRYNPSGTLDSTFGTTGEVITDFDSNHLALQPDGKILVAGSSFNGTDSDFAIARYNSDGTPDTSFGASTNLPDPPPPPDPPVAGEPEGDIDPAKEVTIVITHGWQPVGSGPDWMYEMRDDIERLFPDANVITWRWRDADTPEPAEGVRACSAASDGVGRLPDFTRCVRPAVPLHRTQFRVSRQCSCSNQVAYCNIGRHRSIHDPR